MKTTFEPKEIHSNKGCYSHEQVNNLSFIKQDKIHIHDIINSEIPLKDKFWFVRKACDLSTKQFRSLAIGVATIVLPMYEQKYPNNTAPREAIKAAQDYLNGDIDLETLRQKRYAAADAADAAYAAADAAADAAAVYAADAAACAAADAAAVYAADAAAVYAVNYQKQLKDFLILFTTI